jgi:hypothetical protein
MYFSDLAAFNKLTNSRGKLPCMRVLIATPLYPPEVADAAVYAKELAKRLSERHEVTVVAYAHLPEELPGVKVVAVEKRQSRLARLSAFRKAFAETARDAEIVIAINGASVELPLLAARFPFVLCLADRTAHARAGLLERLVRARARAVVDSTPPHRPEILPLEPKPEEALAAWEAAWRVHIAQLDSLLTHD